VHVPADIGFPLLETSLNVSQRQQEAEPQQVPVIPPLMLAVGEEPQEGPSFPEGPGTWTVHQDFREYGVVIEAVGRNVDLQAHTTRAQFRAGA
jgi:hypothetical protein